MMRFNLALVAGLALTLSAGCGEGSDSSASSCPSADSESGDIMVMTEALNNYAFSSSVDIEVDSIAPNSEISVDWASLHTDFLGDAVDPMNDIDMITLVM